VGLMHIAAASFYILEKGSTGGKNKGLFGFRKHILFSLLITKLSPYFQFIPYLQRFAMETAKT